MPKLSTQSIASPPRVVEQYERFLPLAQELPAARVRVPRIDVHLAVLNAARGVAVVMEHEGDIARIPDISIDQIASLADLGVAVLYAAGRVERFVPVTGQIKAMLVAANRSRARLIVKADVLVVDGVVPAATVAGIRKGRGPIDTASDCVALAALFHDYAGQLAGRVAVTAADIHEANDLGSRLLAVLKPASARRAPNQALLALTEPRDRLWSLFEQTWEAQVWRAGAWLFQRAVDTRVPRLGSRTRTRRSAATPAAAQQA